MSTLGKGSNRSLSGCVRLPGLCLQFLSEAFAVIHFTVFLVAAVAVDHALTLAAIGFSWHRSFSLGLRPVAWERITFPGHYCTDSAFRAWGLLVRSRHQLIHIHQRIGGSGNVERKLKVAVAPCLNQAVRFEVVREVEQDIARRQRNAAPPGSHV